MEQKNETAITFAEWCKEKNVELTGVETMQPIAAIKAAGAAGKVSYITALYPDIRKYESRQRFFMALKKHISAFEVIDANGGKLYLCYLPDELEKLKTEMADKEQASWKEWKAVRDKLSAAKQEQAELAKKKKLLEIGSGSKFENGEGWRRALTIKGRASWAELGRVGAEQQRLADRIKALESASGAALKANEYWRQELAAVGYHKAKGEVQASRAQ